MNFLLPNIFYLFKNWKSEILIWSIHLFLFISLSLLSLPLVRASCFQSEMQSKKTENLSQRNGLKQIWIKKHTKMWNYEGFAEFSLIFG